MDEDLELIRTGVQKEFELGSKAISADELCSQLASAIDELLSKDFSRLVNILYRLDVDETKLKNELKKNQHLPAGELIAKLIIEREIEKNKARKNKQQDRNISEDEKW
jgi:hypothetical protein